MRPLANQLMQQEMLAANEIAMVNLNEQLSLLPEVVTKNANETMQQAQQVLLTELKALQVENAAVKTNLGPIGEKFGSAKDRSLRPTRRSARAVYG